MFLVSKNILQRVYRIRHGGGSGTAFTIDVEGRQYLLTAAHVVNGLKSDSVISIEHANGWQDHKIGAVVFIAGGSDIALISPKTQISPSHPVELGDAAWFYLSETVHFLGFPFGLKVEFLQANSGYPLPFVKRGAIAGFTDPAIGNQVLFIDGWNNPGFSGGPVVVTRAPQVHAVIAVVSGYRANREQVMLNGADIGITYDANTGLVVAHSIQPAIEIAKSAKSGAVLAATPEAT